MSRHDDFEQKTDEWVDRLARIIWVGLWSTVALIIAASIFLCAVGWKILVA